MDNKIYSIQLYYGQGVELYYIGGRVSNGSIPNYEITDIIEHARQNIEDRWYFDILSNGKLIKTIYGNEYVSITFN